MCSKRGHLRQIGYLTINELDSVLKKVWEARNKWQNIGLALGVSQDDLDAIRVSNSDDADKCFAQVLAKWLRSCSRSKSWRVLADALRSPTVGYQCLANNIELSHSIVDGSDHTHNSVNVSNGDGDGNSISGGGGDENTITFQCPCEECSLESYVSDGCPRRQSYPYLDSTKLTKDEKKDLIQVLNHKTREIKKIFRKLLDNTCVSLKECKIPTEELVRCALNIIVNNSEEAPLTLLKEHQEELKRATTVDGVFIALIPHMSFFNYGILEHVIETLGSDNDKESLAQYKCKFNTFCQRRVFEVSPLRVGVSGTEKLKVKKFAVLLTEYNNEVTLIDVNVAAEKFANLLGLKRSALNVEVIDSGSVLLILSLPTFIADAIFPLDPIRTRYLKENGFVLFVPEDSNVMTPEPMQKQTESSQEDQTELQTRCDSHESRSRQHELTQKSIEQSGISEKRIHNSTGENQDSSDYISKEEDDSPSAPPTNKSSQSTMTSKKISPFSNPILSKAFDTHVTDVATAFEGKEFAEMFVPLMKECLQDPNSAAVQAFLAHARKIDFDIEASVKQEFYHKGCKVIALTELEVNKVKRFADRLQDRTNKDIAKHFELLKDLMCEKMFAKEGFQPDDSEWESIIKEIQSKALENASKLHPENLTGSAIHTLRSSATYYIEEVAVVPGSSIEYDPIYSLPPGVQPSAVLNIRMSQWQEAKSEDVLICKCEPQTKSLSSNTLIPFNFASVATACQQLLKPSLFQPCIRNSDSESDLNCSESVCSICNYLDSLINKVFSLTASDDITDTSLKLIEELVESTFFKVAAPLLVSLLYGTLNGISQLRAYQFLVKSLTKIREREDIPQFEKWFLKISCEYISEQGESIKDFPITQRELLSFLFTQKSRDLVSEATNSACSKKAPSLNFILESIINLYIPQIGLLPAQCSIRSVIYFLRALLRLKDQKKPQALNGFTEAVWLNPELSNSAAKVFTYLLPHDYFNMVNEVERLVIPPEECNLELYKREKEIESKINSQEMTHYDAALWYLDLMTTDATVNSAHERVLCLLKAAQHVAYAFSRVAVGDPLHFAYKNAVMMLAYDASQLATKALQPGARIFALNTAYQLTCFVSKISDPSQHSCLNGRVAIGLLRNLYRSSKFTFLLSQPMTADDFWVAAAPYIAKVSASAYNAYIQQLLQIPDEKLPMKRSLLLYQIMEMHYRSGCHVQQPHFQEKRIAAMTTLLSETKWTFEDVTKAMLTDLVQRTDEGFIKREQHLSEHLEIAELKGVVFKYDEHNPSINVIIKPAEGGNGVLSYKDIIEVLQLTADEISTITFSLDPPSGTERFHPFMTLRCYPRKLQDTEFMKSMFHADYLLKFFSTGVEVSAKYPYKFKPIHESLIKDLPHSLDFLQHPPYSMGVSHMSSHRFWIEIEQVTYDELHKENQAIYYIGEVKVQVRSRPMVVNLNGNTMDAKHSEYGPHAKFAHKLTENYEELSKSFPIFTRVKEFSKLQFVVQKHHAHLKRLQNEAPTLFESVSKEIDRLQSLHPIKRNPDSCLWVPATFNNLVYGGVISNFKSSHLEYLSRPEADQVACASDAEPAGFSAGYALFSPFPEGGLKIESHHLLKTQLSQTDKYLICVKVGDTKVELNRRDSDSEVVHVPVAEEQREHTDIDTADVDESTSNDEEIAHSKTHGQKDSKQSERMSKFSDTDPLSGQIKSAKVVPSSETVPDSVQLAHSGEEKSQLPFNVADADRDKTKLHSDAELADMNDGETSPKMQARYDKKTPETLRSSTENKMKVEYDKIKKSVHELAPTEKSDTPVQSPTNVPEKVSLKSENAAMSLDKDTKKNANIETTSEHTGSEFDEDSSNDQPNTIVKFDIDSVMSHAAKQQITFLKRGARADTLLPEFRQSLLNKAIFGEMLNDPRLQEMLQSTHTFNEINFHPNILACHLLKTAIVLRKIVEFHCEYGTESQII